ncbi:meiotically up-regulated gene 190 protein [Lindgomyces ingoldianus]|uniref:Meiotically up-regulated gene 190 protein n=1 Tax=Lindgomyces ingoldianus TaxID=673940 RepID=A0ACB6R5I2_9PLEO|nr:meiotically up-regulated gene 190 protein [Lindgomyces ingoldianus]KAF2474538.1 meiotically up-regulated gene 190 protein [Lindgomyces ingoldianus]
MSGVDDVENSQRKNKAPYTSHHPIPTVQKYREEKQQREEDYRAPDELEDDHSKLDRLGDAYNTLRYGKEAAAPADNTQPYKAENKNFGQDEHVADDHAGRTGKDHQEGDGKESGCDGNTAEDTTEGILHEMDPKKARKAMKKFSADGTEREVTDPVTHLPVTIHDFTGKDLKMTPKNGPPAGSELRSATGGTAMRKSEEQLSAEGQDAQDAHTIMETLFPPPDFAITREQITGVYRKALTAGLGIVSASLTVVVAIFQITRTSTGWSRAFFTLLEIGVSLGVSAAIILGMRQWTENKIRGVWETEVWHAEWQQGKKLAKSQTAESAQWLNSLLASIWPLINPDLFTSVSDTLEDVMQASLPKMVRMISVEDIGQGSEALRILGVRWLPTGAAAKSVSEDGKLKSSNQENNDRKIPGEGEVQKNADNVAEGMEAEEGDFVNVEIAFAYRPSTGRRGMKERAKNAHLYLAFYMPANVKLPVWVELHGIVGTMRLRLQLTPDPPFFSLCTLTFLGQPRVDLSCIPLLKKGPNLMDLPLISRFVQSSVDAAMAEYVTPKSLTLDLKDMLVGDDFKKDTSARGVLVVTIKRAFNFKEGDAGFGPVKKGSADPYVSVGWAKFGKPLWSTRVLQNNMEPVWEETCYILVTPDELNVDERLRVQLWDSDRTTADDDLGRIELDVKGIMRDKETNGKISDREDGFKSLKAGEGMPGKLQWSVGYFSKTRITDEQLTAQDEDPDVKNIDQLRQKVYEQSEKKLREASKDESEEIEQQKAQDFKARQDELIIASPPPQKYPSGILSVQIHQITGLELEAINKNKASKNEGASDEEEEGDDLPSAYCTIILNHQKVFKTRTKPKNAKPFFNAGCERFIADFRNTEIHISVRDARVHEDDPLLGIVYLPLSKLLHERSQIDASFPISGGVGYGRARVSLVFRSVQLQTPHKMLGWEYGTLDIKPVVKAIDVPTDLRSMRMKIRTSLGRGKLHTGTEDSEKSQQDGRVVWKTKKDHVLRIAVRKRHASPLVVEFRKDSTLSDRTPAFCILWLKDIPDNEEQTVRLPIWNGDLSRAENNVLSECGDKVGEIELNLTFWSGLSGYHEALAKKDRHIADIMEVLDACHDNDEMDWDDGTNGEGDSSSSSDSDSTFLPDFLATKSGSSLDENGKRGTVDQLREYKQHAKQLHRRNRGMMQWKGPRTLAWMKHLAKRGEGKVEGLFKHGDSSGGGIETEV